MKMNRKAITPLMATFLLISFAVAVGVVIMNFGRAEVKQEAVCPLTTGLRFAKIGGEEQFCYDAAQKRIQFTVENGVNANIDGLTVSIIGTQRAESFDLLEAKMGKAAAYVGSISHDPAVSGEIRQVKIIPHITLYDHEQICSEQGLVVEEIKLC